jgi:hypothetical protein
VDSGTAFIRANPEDVAQIQRNVAFISVYFVFRLLAYRYRLFPDL